MRTTRAVWSPLSHFLLIFNKNLNLMTQLTAVGSLVHPIISGVSWLLVDWWEFLLGHMGHPPPGFVCTQYVSGQLINWLVNWSIGKLMNWSIDQLVLLMNWSIDQSNKKKSPPIVSTPVPTEHLCFEQHKWDQQLYKKQHHLHWFFHNFFFLVIFAVLNFLEPLV